MINKKSSLTILLILVMSMLGVAFVALASNKGDPFNYTAVDWQSGLAGDVYMPELDESASFSAVSGGSGASVQTAYGVGDWAYDWYLGGDIQLRGVGEFVEIWVANDNDLMFAPDDPRNDDPKNWQITDDMVDYMIEEFDSNIYPNCVAAFGAPADRDGTSTIFEAIGWPAFTYDWIDTDEPQRVILKIFNIHDDNYDDPDYPSYVVGFYNPTYTQSYYNRNMIHIDNWRWWQRIGEEGTQWYPDTNPELTVTRPYVYDSTIAHEYQHNIHSDYNPDDPSFMNEGCSMYAEVVSGYGVDAVYFNYYFNSPDNSLTDWSDQGNINILADYGVAALWTIYLSDHYGGGDFVRHFVQSGIPGIAGINAALADFGFEENFNDVFHDWRLANLLREESGPYSYTSIDLNDPEIIPVFTNDVNGLQWIRGSDDFKTTISIAGYDTGVSKVGPFGTDYIRMETGFGQPRLINFDGDDFNLHGWTQDRDGWYSGETNLIDTLIYGEVEIGSDPTLELTTYWDIEDFWDFGFVQVSTDDGATWTSLENEYTTYDHDPSAHPTVLANLPGLTSWSGFITEDGWVTMTFDLSAYSGNVLVGFRYVTDWAELYEGWRISEVSVGGTPVELTAVYPEADFLVTVVTFDVSAGTHTVTDMSLAEYWLVGVSYTSMEKPDYTVVVVSSTGTEGFADYLLKATPLYSNAF
ncbi:MAG: hypothetical protein ACW98F_06315 [Candidatus Hodarchaeales archaeon]